MGYILKSDQPKYTSSEYTRRNIKYGTGLKTGRSIYLPSKYQDPIGFGITQEILNLKIKDILQRINEVPKVLLKEDFSEKSIQDVLNLTKRGSGFMDIIKFITSNIPVFKNIADAISSGSNAVKSVASTVSEIRNNFTKPLSNKGISDEAKKRVLEGKLPDALTQEILKEANQIKSGDGFFFI